MGGLGFRVWGLGFRVCGLGGRVWGFGGRGRAIGGKIMNLKARFLDHGILLLVPSLTTNV